MIYRSWTTYIAKACVLKQYFLNDLHQNSVNICLTKQLWLHYKIDVR